MNNEAERPSIFVGWVHKGKKQFEVIPESKYKPLLEKLFFEMGVHPGAVFISKMTIVHWVDPNYHKGCKNVCIYDFYKELNGINDPSCYYKEPDLKREAKPVTRNYGYVSPDGRYYHCDYYGHSSLEREIVGHLEDIENPQQYLYEKGWLCIYNDPYNHGTYAVQMGYGKKMTDRQLKTLQRLEIPTTSKGFKECLLGDFA